MSFIRTAGGVELPSPIIDGCGYTISTLVDGGRNTDGFFIGSTIGNDKTKIEINFNVLEPDQMAALLGLFDRSRGGSFVNKFWVWDPSRQDFVLKEMYVGDRTGTPIVLDWSAGRPFAWKNVKASLIER